MPIYRASLNVDFTGQKSNEYQKLVAALLQAGWLYVETSAFVVETQDISIVWRGIELVAKQSGDAGQLSSLTYHIQSAEDFTSSLPYEAAGNHQNGLDQIRNKPFP